MKESNNFSIVFLGVVGHPGLKLEMSHCEVYHCACGPINWEALLFPTI